MPTFLLGIDVSTTATKALLIDESGAVVAVAATEYPFETPRPLWSEQDPSLFWTGTVQSVRQALTRSGISPEQIAAVGLTGQMHGLTLLDAHGAALRPCILWNDQRTDAQCTAITQRVGQERVLLLAEGFEIIKMISSSLSDEPDAWEWSIARFEAQGRVNPPPNGVIVFTGSSSITFWKTLEQDMAPLPVINRGFGGSKIRQVAHYVDRIVIPYHPRAVVLFAGTNDIAGSKPKTAQQIFDGYLAFVKAVHTPSPTTPIYYISITPTPLRWKHWPIVREANRLIEVHTRTDLRLHFIDLTDTILSPDGKPNRSLFRIDRLHPNKAGYAQWTAVIKPILLADLQG